METTETITSTQMEINVDKKINSNGNKVITSNGNKALALIRVIDTKHDFKHLFEEFYANYVGGNVTIKKHSNKNTITSKISASIDQLHSIVDYKTNVKTDTTWTIEYSNVIYNVDETVILDPISISELKDSLKFKAFYDKIPTKRDVIIYIQGKKREFYDANLNDTAGVTAIRKIMGVSNNKNEPTYVSKDAFGMADDFIKKFFNMESNHPFTCYTTETMDPATGGKDIRTEPMECKLVFCYIDQKPVYIHIKKGTGSGRDLTFQFSYNNSELSKEFNTNTMTFKTPSIKDVITQMHKYDENKYRILGAKICKVIKKLSKGNKDSYVPADTIEEKYFSPILELIITVLPREKQEEMVRNPIYYKAIAKIVAMASKTIGDQMYMFDAINYESKYPMKNNIHGAFVASQDTFLNDSIKHTKSTNNIQATRFGTKNIGGSSNYELCIYLKPLSPEKVKDEEKNQVETKKKIIKQILIDYTNLKKKSDTLKFEGLQDAYKEKLTDIATILTQSFGTIEPVGRRGSIQCRIKLNGGDYEVVIAPDITRMIFSYTYVLHSIVRSICLLSIAKETYPEFESEKISPILKLVEFSLTEEDLSNYIDGLLTQIALPEELTLTELNTRLTKMSSFVGQYDDATSYLRVIQDFNSITSAEIYNEISMPNEDSVKDSLNRSVQNIRNNCNVTLPVVDTFKRDKPGLSVQYFDKFVKLYANSTMAGGTTKEGGPSIEVPKVGTKEYDFLRESLRLALTTPTEDIQISRYRPKEVIENKTKEDLQQLQLYENINYILEEYYEEMHMLTDNMLTDNMLTDNMLTDNILTDNMLTDNMLTDNNYYEDVGKIFLELYYDRYTHEVHKDLNTFKTLKKFAHIPTVMSEHLDLKPPASKAPDVSYESDAHTGSNVNVSEIIPLKQKNQFKPDALNNQVSVVSYESKPNDKREPKRRRTGSNDLMLPPITQSNLMPPKPPPNKRDRNDSNDANNRDSNDSDNRPTKRQQPNTSYTNPQNNVPAIPRDNVPSMIPQFYNSKLGLVIGGKRTRKNRCNKKRNTKSRKGNAGKKTCKRRQRKKNKTRRKRSS